MSSKKRKTIGRSPDDMRKSPRIRKATEKLPTVKTDSVLDRRSTDMVPKIPAGASSFSEATPRTLLENFIEGHDTVQTTTRKRPRVETTPGDKSPLKTPVQHSPSKKGNRSFSASLRKKATMNNFLTQEQDGPTPRNMIQAFVASAPTVTPVIGTVIYQHGEETSKSFNLDKTRTDFEVDEDSFLGSYSQPPPDRMQMLKNRKAMHQKRQTVDISKFSSSVRDQLAKKVLVDIPRLEDVEADQPKVLGDIEEMQEDDQVTGELAVTETVILPSTPATFAQECITRSMTKELRKSIRSHQDVFEEFTSSRLPEPLETLPADVGDVVDSSENLQVIQAEVHHSFSTEESDNNDERNSLVEEGLHSVDSDQEPKKDSSVFIEPHGDESCVGEVTVGGAGVHSTEVFEVVSDVQTSVLPETQTEEQSDIQPDPQSSTNIEVPDIPQTDNISIELAQVEILIQESNSINPEQEQDETQRSQSDVPEPLPLETELPVTVELSPTGDSQQLFTDDEDEEEENDASCTGSTPNLKQVLITDLLHSPALQLTDSEIPELDSSLAQLTQTRVKSKTLPEKSQRQLTKPSSKSTQRVKAPKQGTDKPVRLPRSLTKSIFQHFSKSKRISKEVLDEIEKVADSYWENVTKDLMIYSRHAHRKGIDESDVELLMKRQGFVTDKQSMYSLVEEYLPLEYRQEIIPIARSGNKIELKK